MVRLPVRRLRSQRLARSISGACPNQHLLPLFDYVMPRYGSRPFVIGSNYIWGWEVARIARESLRKRAGGSLAGER